MADLGLGPKPPDSHCAVGEGALEPGRPGYEFQRVNLGKSVKSCSISLLVKWQYPAQGCHRTK